MTFAELLEGALNSVNSEHNVAQLRKLTTRTTLHNVDLVTAEIVGELRRDLRKRGRMIPQFDIVIAATAIRHDLALISRDIHFDHVPGLQRA